MELSDAEHLAARRRAAEGLASAWPEGETTADEWLTSLVMELGEDADGPFVRLAIPGSDTASWGIESVDELHEAIDSWVATKAWDLEGDRWQHGDGWREYDGS